DLRGGTSPIQRLSDLKRLADALSHPVHQAAEPLPLVTQGQVAGRGRGTVAAEQRIGQRPGPELGRGCGHLLDGARVDPGPRAGGQSELLDLTLKALLAV